MTVKTVVGIDLGTTFSAIAYINKHGKPEVLTNREGERTTPSVIFFEDDGTPIVGAEARNQAIIEPRRTVRFVKREMGNPSYRFALDGNEHFPEDLSALILKKLKTDAENILGQTLEQAVISVPAYFKDSQREATRQAGRMAGLEVLRIINEPTAAALAYGLDKIGEDQLLLVYDFGGGTFDVTLMQLQGSEFTILATDGDAKLGGKDIDARLVDFFAEEFQREHDIDLRIEPHSNQDLWTKAEQAKKDLSFRNNISQTFSTSGKSLRVDIDRETFYDLIEDIIHKTEELMQHVVEAAQIKWEQVDTILLAGGSSRIPMVREMIQRVAGKSATTESNPDECVAMGAAVQALLIASGDSVEGKEVPPLELAGAGDLVVQDIASHSLGVKALDFDRKTYVNSIIIPRFTPIPCKQKRIYTTNEDNQSRVEIEILQGEDKDPRSPEVQRIGKVILRNLPTHQAGELKIEVTLSYDANGVIEVVAQESKSGQMTREVVMKKAGSLSDEILEQKRASIENMSL